MSLPLDPESSRCHAQPAMNTEFAIRIPQWEDHPGVGPAIGACFRELVHLENLLSRYVEDSDIARINAMGAGERLFIEESTHRILLEALELYGATEGRFDVTLGSRIRGDATDGDLPGRLAVDPGRPMVTCLEPGRQIDLGAIGKGFALDRMGDILAGHGLRGAFLQAGASTLLAMGKGAWRVALGSGEAAVEVVLERAALSASGIGIQGAHILTPDGSRPDAYPHRRVWIQARRASTADAFSTACMLMTADALRANAGVDQFVEAVWRENPEGMVERLV